jgi:phosphatidylserine decarboxylase
VAVILFALVVQFFRNPNRSAIAGELELVAPADGKVVIVEQVNEPEYFHGKRMMISIFMSPLNVHVTRSPIKGTVVYAKYHPGKFLVAWHPKSSTMNERTTVVIESTGGPVLFRQIAGAVARRISLYSKPGSVVKAGEEVGFIRFGSRVDIYLPMDAEILAKVGDKPVGGETLIARLKQA